MNTTALPHWDLTTIFPALDSPEFAQASEALVAALTALTQRFDEQGIMARDTPLPLDESAVALFEMALEGINTASNQANLLQSYLHGFIATDSRNAEAQTRFSELQRQLMRLDQLETRFTAWVGSLDVEALLARSPAARDHTYALRKARIQAQHLMSPAEEALASELNLTGGSAWAKLYNNFSSQIKAEVELNGELQTLPMTALRNLAYEADRDLRQRAYEAELAAWEANALPIAAAMNSIKGQMNVLTARRGWESPLDVALFNNNIDRQTLDVMLDAAREYFPAFRRYLRAKARALGVEQLAWFDLFAPLPNAASRTWTFPAAQDFILEQFGAFSPRLRGMAERAFHERWIDAEPRDGKRGGAFCMWVRGGESRVLANFKEAYSGVDTLSHELGHAYHNLTRADCTYIQRQTPMTLAETASNFCELLVRRAAMESAAPAEQIAILEASLQDATQVIVDITSRFLFEREVFERRQQRELSVEQLNTLMLEAQGETYGDGLDPDYLHPYMWAVKPHYYTVVFYNFPYMFGSLFSMGLFARYRQDPQPFLAHYEALLAATGMDDAAALAARFDIDVHSPDFWRSSLELVSEEITRFEQLVG